MEKPFGTIKVDVDSIHHLIRFYGEDSAGCEEINLVYQKGLKRFKKLARRIGIKMTFMVVGEDLQNSANQEIIENLWKDGHEIANHSMHHVYGFSNLPPTKKKEEIEKADTLIQSVTGELPKGFKAPGWDIDHETIKILEERGYKYDSSIFPSMLNPLMNLFHKILKQKGSNQVSSGHGDTRFAFAPHRPYFPAPDRLWKKVGQRGIIEVPSTTISTVGVPFYSSFNFITGKKIFDFSIRFIKKNPCNYVFHAVDLMAPEELTSIIKHPNANSPLSRKWSMCEYFLKRLNENFNLIATIDMVKYLARSYL